MFKILTNATTSKQALEILETSHKDIDKVKKIQESKSISDYFTMSFGDYKLNGDMMKIFISLKRSLTL